MRWTGRFSYSLYLWHWPLLILLPDAVGHALSVPQRLAAIAAAVLLSALTYFAIEQPFQRQRELVTKPHRGLAVGSALVTASVAVALVVPTDQPAGRNRRGDRATTYRRIGGADAGR